MKLDNTFRLNRYGIAVRLADEKDSEFLLSLRTDEKLSRFLHATDNDLEKQRQWMCAYKKREMEGTDYYFIYSIANSPFGANRIYDIKDNVGTGGSWICKPQMDPEYSVATLLIMRDIMFEILGLEYDKFDVRKGNTHVRKLHLMMGAKKIGETELDDLFILSKEDYVENKKNIIEMLNLEI